MGRSWFAFGSDFAGETLAGRPAAGPNPKPRSAVVSGAGMDAVRATDYRENRSRHDRYVVAPDGVYRRSAEAR